MPPEPATGFYLPSRKALDENQPVTVGTKNGAVARMHPYADAACQLNWKGDNPAYLA